MNHCEENSLLIRIALRNAGDLMKGILFMNESEINQVVPYNNIPIGQGWAIIFFMGLLEEQKINMGLLEEQEIKGRMWPAGRAMPRSAIEAR